VRPKMPAGRARTMCAWPTEIESKYNKMTTVFFGSSYKAVQVCEYCPVLLCKHLIFRYVLPKDMLCNLLKLLTCAAL